MKLVAPTIKHKHIMRVLCAWAMFLTFEFGTDSRLFIGRLSQLGTSCSIQKQACMSLVCTHRPYLSRLCLGAKILYLWEPVSKIPCSISGHLLIVLQIEIQF